jgi:dynein heavy chain
VLISSLTEEILLYVFFLFTGLNQDYPIPESVDKVDISLPMEGTLYDYTYNFKHKGSWKYWPDVLKSVHPVEIVNIQHMLIPTSETLRLVSGIYLLHFEQTSPYSCSQKTSMCH